MNLGAELVAIPSPDPGRAREAEGLFRHALALRPDRPFAYHGLGVALALQRRYEEAEAAFRAYMEREPSAATGPADLGLLRMEQQRYGEAIDFFRRALTLSPGSPRLAAELARALQGRGEELRRDGKGIEADALLAEAAALRNNPPGAAGPPNQRSGTTTVR